VIRALLRKQKSNPVLIGDAGVGKTSIVEGIALRAAQPEAPEEIRDLRFVELLMGPLAATAKFRGDFEEVMSRILGEVASDPELVLFVDEIHTLVGTGGGGPLDAANLLKPALARDKLRCIGATTPAEYRKHIEKDPALERRFQPVRVEEPTPEQTRVILDGVRAILESHHRVKLEDAAIDCAIELSVRFLPDRRLPDKARDLLDQAAASRRFLTLSPAKRKETPIVQPEDVAAVVSDWTGIPMERLSPDVQRRLRTMDESLKARVIGQDHAVDAVTSVLRTALVGLSDRRRPYGVFLFLGPTGVGKTELAKAVAEQVFGDARHLVRIDMSELSEPHAVSRLIGAPPGYVGHEDGGQLTNAVMRMPYCVILFDEVEKAHPKVADVFLQLFDDGQLTDSSGKKVDFKSTIVIMTSNLGQAEKKPMGFRAGDDAAPAPAPLPRELLGFFRPELLNRVGRVVQFRALDPADVKQIIDKILREVSRRLAGRGIELSLTPQAYDAVARLGFDRERGARELERVIERQIVQPLATGLLMGRFSRGDVVRADARDGGIFLTTDA
jgi:ATP-dependent Clp protease ATP-binding subunit ClpC